MNIAEALELLGIDTLDDKSKQDITKIYRKLIKKHHPDLFSNQPELLIKNEEITKDINEAYDLITSALERSKLIQQFSNAKATKVVFAIIPFDKLPGLYSGDTIKLKYNGAEFILTSGNIRANRIVLDISCCIIVDGISYKFSALKPWVIKDEYEINCDIPIVEDHTLDVTVLAYGKRVNLKLSSMRTQLRLRYENSVVLDVCISKSIIGKDKQ